MGEGKHAPADDSLPADVLAEIEQHCSENNNGERAASHSRQAMTERALHYHRTVGQRRGSYAPHQPTKPSDGTPESLYESGRWSRLADQGYTLPDGPDPAADTTGARLGYASRVVGSQRVYAVPVPGDPGYE